MATQCSLACLLVTAHCLCAAETPPQVAQWVRDLDDDAFAVREAATQKLLAAGRGVIDAVATAALGNSVEVTQRALRILQEFSTARDELTAAAAKKALAGLASSKHPAAAPRAQEILRAHLLRFAAELEQAGAQVRIVAGAVVAVNLDRVQDVAAKLPLLRQLPDLEEVSLSNAQIEDAALAQLTGLPRLRVLNLFSSRIGDDGLKHLKDMPALRWLPMGHTRVTDAGLTHLKDLVHLEYLGLRGNQVTDAGLVHLKKLTNLTGLYLGETKVTDAGLIHLKGMTKMAYLRLHTVAVTDAGLEHLLGMTKLERLELWDTKVTPEGAARLKEKLPGVQIVTDRP